MDKTEKYFQLGMDNHYLGCHQCDQMARLFFNFCHLHKWKSGQLHTYKICQSGFKSMLNAKYTLKKLRKTLPKGRNFVNYGHTGSHSPLLPSLYFKSLRFRITLGGPFTQMDKSPIGREHSRRYKSSLDNFSSAVSYSALTIEPF